MSVNEATILIWSILPIGMIALAVRIYLDNKKQNKLDNKGESNE